MQTEKQHAGEASSQANNGAGDQERMTRREALALVSKHAVYTAPAVLAVLWTKNAVAGSPVGET